MNSLQGIATDQDEKLMSREELKTSTLQTMDLN